MGTFIKTYECSLILFPGIFYVDVSVPTATDRSESDDVIFDATEFRAAVTQLLDLIMNENFCHPYGSVAGAVA